MNNLIWWLTNSCIVTKESKSSTRGMLQLVAAGKEKRLLSGTWIIWFLLSLKTQINQQMLLIFSSWAFLMNSKSKKLDQGQKKNDEETQICAFTHETEIWNTNKSSRCEIKGVLWSFLVYIQRFSPTHWTSDFSLKGWNLQTEERALVFFTAFVGVSWHVAATCWSAEGGNMHHVTSRTKPANEKAPQH